MLFTLACSALAGCRVVPGATQRPNRASTIPHLTTSPPHHFHAPMPAAEALFAAPLLGAALVLGVVVERLKQSAIVG